LRLPSCPCCPTRRSSELLTYGRPAVGVLGVSVFVHHVQQLAVGSVVVALFLFFLRHFALCFHTHFVNLCMQHPFGFHPHGHFQLDRKSTRLNSSHVKISY